MSETASISEGDIAQLIRAIDVFAEKTFGKAGMDFPLPYSLVQPDGTLGPDPAPVQARKAVAAITVFNPAAVDAARRIEAAHRAL